MPMRIDHDIGIYSEHYAMVLKWYSLAFKDKHPSRDDEKPIIFQGNL